MYLDALGILCFFDDPRVDIVGAVGFGVPGTHLIRSRSTIHTNPLLASTRRVVSQYVCFCNGHVVELFSSVSISDVVNVEIKYLFPSLERLSGKQNLLNVYAVDTLNGGERIDIGAFPCSSDV